MAQVSNGSGRVFAYARVSSGDQRLDRQLAELAEAGVDVEDHEAAPRRRRLYTDKLTGARARRPGLDHLLDRLGDGDELVVCSLDRLGRSLLDLHALVDELMRMGVTVRFLKEDMVFCPDRQDPRGQLVFNMFAAVAEFERAIIRERQAEGIAAARTAGRVGGRPRALTDELVQYVREKRAERPAPSIAAIARELAVSRATVYRALQRLPEQ